MGRVALWRSGVGTCCGKYPGQCAHGLDSTSLFLFQPLRARLSLTLSPCPQPVVPVNLVPASGSLSKGCTVRWLLQGRLDLSRLWQPGAPSLRISKGPWRPSVGPRRVWRWTVHPVTPKPPHSCLHGALTVTSPWAKPWTPHFQSRSTGLSPNHIPSGLLNAASCLPRPRLPCALSPVAWLSPKPDLLEPPDCLLDSRDDNHTPCPRMKSGLLTFLHLCPGGSSPGLGTPGGQLKR